MSRKSLLWSIVIIAAVFMATSALTFGPEAWANTRDGGRDIQPGGWPAKIHSMYRGSSGETPIDFGQVPGTHGFIVTDVVCRSAAYNHWQLHVQNGSPLQTVATFQFVAEQNLFLRSYHFQSGVVLESGTPLQVVPEGIAGDLRVTISGYEY